MNLPALPKILIWGASGHAGVVAEIIRLSNQHQIMGFLANTPDAPARFQNLPVFHSLDELPQGSEEYPSHAVVAVGDCRVRMRLAEEVRKHGLILTSAIHPRAVVSAESSVGAGTVVMAGAIVNPGCELGSNVIVNTGATVDHDCRIGDGVHIGPGVHLGGCTTVGSMTWLGIGAIIRNRVTIGTGAMIGAGAVVVSDVPDHVMAYGVPAKPVRKI